MRSGLFVLLLSLVLYSANVFADNTDLSPLIEKGEALIQKGSYPAAIAVFETVLTKDPRNTEALSSLLAACDSYSQKLITENRYKQAEVYLEKMQQVIQKMESIPPRMFKSEELRTQSRIKREMASAKSFMVDGNKGDGTDLISLNAGREQYNEAVKYFTKRQYDIAETMLKESVRLDPSNPYAFELLGEIANLNHRLDEAEKYYKQAFALNSDPKLRTKYEKLMREKKIDKTQQQYEDEHFIIRYKRSESIDGSVVRELLRDAYRSISQELGYYPKYKIPVVLYDREEYQSLLGNVPHWSGAVYDGKIRVPIYENQSNQKEQELKKLINHELMHAFVLDISQTKCPVWLNEGLAQYQENKIKKIDFSLLASAVKQGNVMKLDEIMYLDLSKQSGNKVLLFYLEAFSFVRYVLNESKMYNMKQFLAALGKGEPLEQAFETAFGRSFKDMTQSWEKQVLDGNF